ncbi:MAG: phosphate signaling complex protein PhoU [Verrucomicrobiota bacterium]
MTIQFHHEIEKLQGDLLGLSTIVEENTKKALKAFETRDLELAEEVIQKDFEIDNREVELEEECLKLLALYQPVAIDLRFIIAALKINNDLERVGDLGGNIAKRVKIYAKYPDIQSPFDLEKMAQSSFALLHKSLDSFIKFDAAMAQDVRINDDEVDTYNEEAQQLISRAMREEPGKEEGFLQLIWVAKHLERVADHATNIAEDIIYMLRGQIVRHQNEPDIEGTGESSAGKETKSE